MDLLDRAIIVTVLFTGVFLYLNYFTETFDSYGNYSLQEANTIINAMPEGTVILGGWSHAVCFETRHLCFTEYKWEAGFMPLQIHEIRVNNDKGVFKTLGITHVIFPKEGKEESTLFENYPDLMDNVELQLEFKVGHYDLEVYKLVGKYEPE